MKPNSKIMDSELKRAGENIQRVLDVIEDMRCSILIAFYRFNSSDEIMQIFEELLSAFRQPTDGISFFLRCFNDSESEEDFLRMLNSGGHNGSSKL